MVVNKMKTVPCGSQQDIQLMSVCQWRSLRPGRGSWSDRRHDKRPYAAASSVPLSRHKHGACCVGDIVYVVGGKDRSTSFRDVWQFHIKQREWRLVHLRGSSLPFLQGHSVVAHKRLVLIFGGTFSDSVGDVQLWIINTDLGHLHEVWIEPGSLQPTCRRDHSAVVHNNNMYVYGGFVDSAGSSQEFWAYSIEEEEWTEISTLSQNQPGRRHGHSAVVVDNAMWLYGGMSGLTSRSDLWRYSFVLHQWQRVKGLGSSPPLSGHTANVVHNQMVLVGGNIQGKPVADVWLFNFDTTMWQKLQTSGPAILPALCYHASVSCDQSHYTEGQSVHTQSTPHLKPAAKYQLQADQRFVVRPRSSPPVSKQHADFRELLRRVPRTLDPRSPVVPGTGCSGDKVMGVVHHGQLARERMVDDGGDKTINSCNDTDDVHIQVNMKQHLLTSTPCGSADGAGDFTSPFLQDKGNHSPVEDERRLEEASFCSNRRCSTTDHPACAIDHPTSFTSVAGLAMSLSAPERLSTDLKSNAVKNEDLVRRLSVELTSGTNNHNILGGLNTEGNCVCTNVWPSHGDFNDLIIEDLETMEPSGVEDVKISYPPKHPLLPPAANPFLPLSNPASPHNIFQHNTSGGNAECCWSDVCSSHDLAVRSGKTSVPSQIKSLACDRMNVSDLSSHSGWSMVDLSGHKCHPQSSDGHIPHDAQSVEAETSFTILPSHRAGLSCTEQTSVPPHKDRDCMEGIGRSTEGGVYVGDGENADLRHSEGSAADTRTSQPMEAGVRSQSRLSMHDGISSRELRLSVPQSGRQMSSGPSHDTRNRRDPHEQEVEPAEPCLLVFGGRTEEMGSLHPKSLPVWKGVFF